MKISLNWLKDFVDIDITVDELCKKLVSCGFEIEEVIDLSEKIKNVIVVKIIETAKHPQADKLFVCKVDTGEGIAQVVTNDKSLAAGDLVPLALDGAKLAKGPKIKAGEIRGAHSVGMFCGLEELDLTVQEYPQAGEGVLKLGTLCRPGQNINEVLQNDDVVLDVAITANRPDANSVLGIAREVSAVTGKPLKQIDLAYKTCGFSTRDLINIKNTSTVKCPRYIGHAVKDIKIEPSPLIIRKRLKAVGLRPINNIVDITNYILIETGQPMHAFDLKRLKGGEIIIRNAQNGESITALDGQKYTLCADDLAICDSTDPVAIAGVMGGLYSAVDNDTKDIVLESARFKRDSIRHTSRRINLRSDSSQRFERGIDFYSQEIGLKRALHLIDKYGWGKIASEWIDLSTEDKAENIIRINPEKICRILGIHISADKMVEILNSLQIFSHIEGEEIVCVIPRFREDIEHHNDIAEEIIRIYGYDNITPTLLNTGGTVKGGKTKEQALSDKIKDILAGQGCYEIVTYSFFTPKAFDILRLSMNDPLRKAILIANPIGEDLSVMRTTLAYSMISALSSNYVKGNKEARLFECARVYIPDRLPMEELPKEEEKLMIGLLGENEDFYSLKSIIEEMADVLGISLNFAPNEYTFLHPGRSAMITDCDNNTVGYAGELIQDIADTFDCDRRLYIAELDMRKLIAKATDVRPYLPYSKYPSMERDIAISVGEDIYARDILDVINSYKGEILEKAEIFDVYKGAQVEAGKKSVAIKLLFRHLSRTLNEKEVSEKIEAILAELSHKFSAELRK